MIAAVSFAWQRTTPPARNVTMTAGFSGTTRELVAEALASQISQHGVHCEMVETGGSQTEVEALIAGKADFAMISGAFRIGPDVPVRVVTPLQLEALHLLVRQQLADAVTGNLAALEGHIIDVGPPHSATAQLATQVLEFAEVRRADASDPRGYRALTTETDALAEAIATRETALLPDAIFHLATVPSVLARDLIRDHDYNLVPLPFAEALRLSAVIATDGKPHVEPDDQRRLAADVVLPPFLYQTKPAIPAAPLPTLGARLHLIARESVSPETVEAVLEAVFDSQFARLMHPPLDRTALTGFPRAELHAGALLFLDRNAPAITNEAVGDLSNTISILGALFGSGAFLVQGYRQRRRAKRDEIIAEHLMRVVGLERRVVEIELAADIQLDDLIAVQRELLQLKGETLDRFTHGDIDGRATLADLLVPIRALRDHVGEMLLHVRDSLEEQARAEGRTAGAVWDEAAAKASDEIDEESRTRSSE